MKKNLLKLMALTAALTLTSRALAEDTVKVGVLHSLSGTMAISETSLRDVLLFAFDQINAAGGIKVGDKMYKIEPVVVDGASNWPLFAEKAKELSGTRQSGRHVRLLDFCEPQIRAACV